MAMDREIDEVIARWPPSWKIGFKSPVKNTADTSTVVKGPSGSMGKDTGTIVTIDIPSMQPPTKDTIADNQADPPDTHARGTKQTETSVQGA